MNEESKARRQRCEIGPGGRGEKIRVDEQESELVGI